MSLTPENLERLFPFRIELTLTGEVISTGEKVTKLAQIHKGDQILDLFNVIEPTRTKSWDAEQLLGRLVLLQDKSSGFMLRGEVIIEPEKCIYMCLPWVNASKDLLELGLTLSDIPVHQTLAEYLFAQSAHELTMQDEKRNAAIIQENNRLLVYRERLFGNLIDNLPSGGAILMRQDGRVLIAGGTDLPFNIKVPYNEVGVPIEELFGDRADEIKSFLEIDIDQEGKFDFEVDNQVYRCAVSYLPHPKSHRARWLLIFQNITEDLQIRGQAERLQRLDSVGHLAGGIAHDFNNYLASILGNISLALDEESNPAEEVLRDAEKACLAARQLTRQLLTFSKGGNPVRSINPVGPTVRDAVKFSLSGTNLKWRVDIAEGLWLSNFDAGQVSQIINNLCVNAAQTIGESGEVIVTLTNCQVDTEISLLDAGCYIKIDVADNGEGIDSEVLSRIWNPYFTTKKTGSGLGLATCHSIAKRHGGTMTVKSKLGVGSTFTLWLPACDNSQCDSSQRGQYRTSADLSSYRILLMDDQAPIRMVASRMLKKLDQEVTVTEEGVGTIIRYRREYEKGNPYDIVILDMTIPGAMGGSETLQHIKKINPEVYAVVCTGYTDAANIDSIESIGFSDCLPKPFTAEEMQIMLTKFEQQNCLSA